MTNRFCVRCGAENTDSRFRFCARCGAEFGADAADSGATVVKPMPTSQPASSAPLSAPLTSTPNVAAPARMAGAYQPASARRPDSATPRLIAVVVLMVYAGVEIWGLVGDPEVKAPISRDGFSGFTYFPWELKLDSLAGLALLLVLLAAIVAPRGGRIACGLLMLLVGAAYLAGLFLIYSREHALGDWIQHSGPNFGTYLAVGTSAMIGGVVYFASSVADRA